MICNINPVKKRHISIILFLFHDLHIFGKLVEKYFPTTIRHRLRIISTTGTIHTFQILFFVFNFSSFNNFLQELFFKVFVGFVFCLQAVLDVIDADKDGKISINQLLMVMECSGQGPVKRENVETLVRNAKSSVHSELLPMIRSCTFYKIYTQKPFYKIHTQKL